MRMSSDEEPVIEIEDVFVDREKAMKYLEDELRSRKNHKVEMAIRITQAPGTGKTRLLQEFISKMEREGKGVGIYINSPEIENWITGSLTNLESILWRAVFLPVAEEVMDVDQLDIIDVKGLLKKYNLEDYIPYSKFEIIREENLTYDDMLITFSSRLPHALGRPLIIVFDEIQATIGRMTDRFQNEKGQGLFRNIINLAANLIKRKNVLVILSGTNYKIMHFLGKLGSQLYEKTEEYRLPPLDAKAIEEFYNRIFGEPQNEVEEQLREWMIVNSNGVPRTMVWMAEALQKVDFKQISISNIEEVIDELDAAVMERIDVSRIQDLMELEYGRELLEWIAYRAIIEKEIPIVSISKMSYEKATTNNICTVDDLIDKGVVHLLDGHIEVRNNYYLKALWNVLDIEEGILQELLDLSGLIKEDALHLLSWQLNVLGAYFEIAIALAIYKISQTGEFNLASLFDYGNEQKVILTKFNKLERIPHILLDNEKLSNDTIYAIPRAPGVDIILKSVDGSLVYIQCKNWDRKISKKKLKEIIKSMENFENRFGTGIKILVLSQKLDEQLQQIAEQKGVYTISNVKPLLGDKILEFFETARKRAKEVEPLIFRIEAGKERWFEK